MMPDTLPEPDWDSPELKGADWATLVLSEWEDAEYLSMPYRPATLGDLLDRNDVIIVGRPKIVEVTDNDRR